MYNVTDDAVVRAKQDKEFFYIESYSYISERCLPEVYDFSTIW